MEITLNLIIMTVCAAIGAALMLSDEATAAEVTEENVWPSQAPGSEGIENTERSEDLREPGDARGPSRRIYDVTVPTLTYYHPPKDKATGTAIIVCPGGAFRRLAIDHEGHEVAKWLNSIGVTAAVLKYRSGKQIKGRDDIEALSVADGKRAVRLLRSKAEQLGIKPDRIGMMGFSAGGVLISRLLANMDEGNAKASDPVARISCRPDFAAIIYAPIPTLNAKTITKNTPPIFIAHAADDGIPGDDCAKLFVDLHKAGVPVELHIFSTGGHGFGLGVRGGSVTAWPGLYENWLKVYQKFMDTFSPDYLAPIGGQAKATLSPGMTVPYTDLDGVARTAKATAAQIGEDGKLFSGWNRESVGRKIAYASCCLRSDKPRTVKCYFGSDDEARIWANGALVHRVDTPRSCKARNDNFEIELKAGLNPITVKVSQRTMTWTFILEAPASDLDSPEAKPAEPTTVAVNDLSADGKIPHWTVIVFDIAENK